MTPGPVSHHVDALKLESDAEVDLIEILLRDNTTVFRFVNGPTRTWQGATYENVPVSIGGEEETGEDRHSRPALRIFNPKKVFSPFVQQGLFELATVTRRRVLLTNLLANANIAQTRVWLLSRITGMSSQMLEAELRSPLDGPNLTVPVRSYTPPEFPFVRV